MITAAIAVPHPPLIMPDIGKGEERKIQRTIDAYREAMRVLAQTSPQTVVVISPHVVSYADYFHISPGAAARGDFSRFGARQLKAEAAYDTALVSAIERRASEAGLPAGTNGERDAAFDHATLIPLLFLQEVCPDCRIVRIGLSGLGPDAHYRLGMCIRDAAEALGRRLAIIGSGDLSHKLKADGPYGYAPEGPELDGLITKALETGNFEGLLDIPPTLAEKGAECGLNTFIMMAGALDGRSISARLLSYEGTFGVGYAVATFLPGEKDGARRILESYEKRVHTEAAHARANEDAWVRLARLSVETYVKTGQLAALPEGLPGELLSARAGVFVSLHKHGRLRGCIGTTAPTTESVAHEIVQNAISAAASDPRFDPVRADELGALTIKVDVLLAPEDISSTGALDVKRYGVIVSSGHKRGLLLPDLDGVDTVAQQVDIARQKAGIPANAPISLQRFEVIRHH